MKKHLTIITTTRCNFQCKHCLREYYSKHADIPLSLVDLALKEAAEMGVKQAALTGGEPSLHPKFEKLIDLISGKHQLMWSVVTNGFLPHSYDYAIQSYPDKCAFIAVSLDGGTQKTHDYIRKDGSFGNTLDSIDYFKSQGIRTKIAFTVNALNFKEKRKILQIGLDHQVDEIRFAGLVPNHFNRDLRITQEQKEQVVSLIDQLQKTNFPIKITYTTSLYTVQDPEHFCRNVTDPEPAINPYGEYIFCCDTGGRGAVFGDLRENSFSELYIQQLKKSVWLKNKRREMIENNDIFQDFNSCYFCNEAFDLNRVSEFGDSENGKQNFRTEPQLKSISPKLEIKDETKIR